MSGAFGKNKLKTTDYRAAAGSNVDRLKVLVLTDQYPNSILPVWGIFNQQQLDALSRLCDLRVIAPIHWTNFVRRAKFSVPPRFKPYPVIWKAFWYFPFFKRNWHGRAFFWSAWPEILRQANDQKPDVIFATWLFPPGWAGYLAAKRLGLPLVIKVHGSDLMLLKNDPVRLPYLRQALEGAHSVVAVSRPLADEALALGARRVKVVTNGLNRDLFTPSDQREARLELGLPSEGKLLAFIGRLTPVKGPDLALEALARIPQVQLVMVGGGAMAHSLRDMAQKLGVAQRVIWAGSQPHHHVPRYLAAADALVLPSRSEGDPNAVLEALGCGRPVAAAAVGGVPQIITDGQNGALFEAENVEAMVNAVERVLSVDWRPEQLSQALIGRSWAGGAQQILQVLAQASGKEV